MGKVQEEALKAYPDQMGPSDKPCYEDDARVTRKLREAFQEGYGKVLKDLHAWACGEYNAAEINGEDERMLVFQEVKRKIVSLW